jgi:ethanolamine permease
MQTNSLSSKSRALKGSKASGDYGDSMSAKAKSSKGSLYRLDSISRFKLGLSKWDLIIYLLNVSVGGFFSHWSQGFSKGFASFMVAIFAVGSAAVCNGVNSNELSTAFPYSGGIFGFSRVTLSYFAAYMVGCCEITAAIMFFSITSLTLGKIVTGMNPQNWDYTMEPIVWVVYITLTSLMFVYGGKYVYIVQKVLCGMSLVIFVMFCLGSLKFVDFHENASFHTDSGSLYEPHSPKKWFVEGISGFLYALPMALWFFQAIPTVAVTADDSDDPKASFPFATNCSILILVPMVICLVFIWVSLPPALSPIDANSLTPLSAGFKLMFNTSSPYLAILSIPAIVTSGFGFIFTYSKLFFSLAQSKILSRYLQRRDTITGVPYVAVLLGALISFGCCLVSFYVENYWNHNRNIDHFSSISLLFNIAVLSCLMVYTAQSLCYVFLQRKFRNLTRSYNSPLGICGSVYSCCIWLICLIAIAGFQRDGHASIIVFLVFLAVFSAYYRVVAKDVQIISKAETKVLFTAHVINCKYKLRKPWFRLSWLLTFFCVSRQHQENSKSVTPHWRRNEFGEDPQVVAPHDTNHAEAVRQ